MTDFDETLDLVNDQDEVIGTIPRSLADTDAQYIHREIAIQIFDSQKRLLIQQRSRNKKTFPLYWIISVAGHVPAGVDPLVCAHNELQEELGFDTKLTYLRKDFDHMPHQTMFSYVYLGQYPEGAEIKVDHSEIEQIKFISQKELEDMLASGEKFEPGSLQLFRDFFAGKLNF